jgi:tetratricopeptide (TPR) repeat protein
MNDIDNFPTDELTAELEALLVNNASPEEFARRLFHFTYERTRASDPLLAEMLRACAIPRTFNATIIGALRAAEEEVTTNTRLLHELLAFSFVLPVPASADYTYHDNTRQLLLGQWQEADQRPQYEQYQARLVVCYQRQGEAAFQGKQYDNALAYFNRALDVTTAHGRLYSWRGRTQVALGAYQAALADLTQAIARQCADFATYFAVATAHYYLGDYPACTTSLTQAIALDGSDAAAYHNRGLTYKAQQAYGLALADYGEAIRLNPHDADAYHNRGNTYHAQQAYGLALADYGEAIRLNPHHAAAYNNRGATYKAQQAYGLALADYSEAIPLNPHDAAAYYNTACVYGLQGQLAHLLPPLRHAFALDQAGGSTRLVELTHSDPDFDLVRTEPAFQALLAEFAVGK